MYHLQPIDGLELEPLPAELESAIDLYDDFLLKVKQKFESLTNTRIKSKYYMLCISSNSGTFPQ